MIPSSFFICRYTTIYYYYYHHIILAYSDLSHHMITYLPRLALFSPVFIVLCSPLFVPFPASISLGVSTSRPLTAIVVVGFGYLTFGVAVRYTSRIKLWIATGVAATETSEKWIWFSTSDVFESRWNRCHSNC